MDEFRAGQRRFQWTETLISRITAALGGSYAGLWAVVLGLALLSPALFTGLNADDHYVRAVLKGFPGLPDVGTGRLDCFTFADGVPAHNAARKECGLMPWWGSPEAKVSFFRPLSALTHALDLWLLEPHYFLMHLHSFAWYGLLCAAAWALYRRTASLPWVAGLAALMYAVDDAHGIPAGWLSGRNAVLTALAGVCVLLAHHEWRSRGWKPGLPVACAALILGMGCGEGALAIPGYLLAYAVCLDDGPWRRRVGYLTVYGALGVAYLIVYALLGYGTRDTALYMDPFRQTGNFLTAMARHLPVLLSAQLGVQPAGPYILLTSTHAQWLYVALAVGCLLVIGAALWPLLRTDRMARFWALGMVLAALPVCSTIPGERLLCLVGLGAFGLLSQYLAFVKERREAAPGPTWRFRRWIAGFFLVAHVVVAPVSLPFSSLSLLVLQGGISRGMVHIPDDPAIEKQSLVFLNAPVDVYTTSMPAMRISLGGHVPPRTWALTVGPGCVRASREDEHTLLVENDEGFFGYPFGVLYRGPNTPYRVGDRADTGGFAAEVLRLAPSGLPSAVRFRFEKALDDPVLRWHCYTVSGLESWTPPPIGASTEVCSENPFHRWRDW